MLKGGSFVFLSCRSVSGKKLCSSCGHPLGKGAAMIIETLSLYFHIHCFKVGRILNLDLTFILFDTEIFHLWNLQYTKLVIVQESKINHSA